MRTTRPAGELPKKHFQPLPFIFLTKEVSLNTPIECEPQDQQTNYQYKTFNHFQSFFSQKNFPLTHQQNATHRISRRITNIKLSTTNIHFITKEFSLYRPIECESKDQLEIYQKCTFNHFQSFFTQKSFPLTDQQNANHKTSWRLIKNPLSTTSSHFSHKRVFLKQSNIMRTTRPAGGLPKKSFQPVPFILLIKEFSLNRPIEYVHKTSWRFTKNALSTTSSHFSHKRIFS